MGCAPSKKDKPESAGDEAPVAAAPEKKAADTAPAAAAAPKKEERKDKSSEFLSEDLKALMSDYFNRYDLDGSKTINSSEELKQLCTNLVVKLDLDKDVSDIDKVVGEAGKFQDDDGGADSDNNWSLEDFIKWFTTPGHFDVNKAWKAGDQSEEDEEPSAENPFIEGTYVGEITNDDGSLKYTQVVKKYGKLKNGEMTGQQIEDVKEFAFFLRKDKDKPGSLLERPGRDSCGLHQITGSIDGESIKIRITYDDLDNDQATSEPELVLEGKWCGADDKFAFEGTWTNEKEGSTAQMKYLGLEGVESGKFKLTKRLRDDA